VLLKAAAQCGGYNEGMHRNLLAALLLALAPCTFAQVDAPTTRDVAAETRAPGAPPSAPLPDGPLPGVPEIAPPASLECYPGAIYRKAASSHDKWTGVEVVVVVPTLTTDPARVRARDGRPLDNASIYVGGRIGPDGIDEGVEVDAGVSWEVVRELDGSVSKIPKAFRPFWRNKEWKTGPAKPEYYYYPGDTLRIICLTSAADKLKLKIELLARAGSKPLLEGETPISTFEVEFDAPGMGPGVVQQFKRVCAIDQFGREGGETDPTAARLDNVIYKEAWLYRGEQRLPMNSKRFTDMRCPDPRRVEVQRDDDGMGETVSLKGLRAK